MNDKTDRVTIAEEKNIIKTIPIGTLTFAEHPDVAREFVDFVASETGRGIFGQFGYRTYEQDS
jgi:ABC-type molybdate transport system substrate-binding protein